MSQKVPPRRVYRPVGIPTTILLQILEEGRKYRRAEILARVVRGEITPEFGICLIYRGLVIPAAMIVLLLLYALARP